MNLKKYILGLGMMAGITSAQAQGLEGILVEAFYQANAADAAHTVSEGYSIPLTEGAVTYRVYVDMAAGYKFVQMFGNASKNLTFATTTSFYNDENYDAQTGPTTSVLNTRRHTAMIDSWITAGGAANGKVGVPKDEDTDGSIANPHTNGILGNTLGGCFGSQITGATGKDGMLASSGTTYVTPNTLGMSGSILNALTAGNTLGSIVINNGSIASLGGIVGATSSNRVLVGQFTTTGTFTFNINVQLLSPTGATETYVHGNPGTGQLTHPTLTKTTANPSITISQNNTASCSGSTINFTASAINVGTGPVYQWKVNSLDIPNANSNSFSSSNLTNGDVVSCVVTPGCLSSSSSAVTSNAITMNFTDNVTPSVSIVSNDADNSFCVGTSVTFNATPVNGGSSPIYTWKRNNVQVGSNSQTFTSNILQNNDVITLVMTANNPCQTTATANSNPINNLVIANATPSVVIASNDADNSICSGTSVTFSATPTNGGSNPNFQWKLNGVNVGTGGATYTNTSLVNNDAVTVVLTANNTCQTTATANGNTITTLVITPIIYYTDADGDNYGTGTAQSLCTNPGTGYATANGDCNDNNSAIKPGATEICGNSVDEDCSGADLVCPLDPIASAVPVIGINFFGSGVQSNQIVNLSTGFDYIQSPGPGLDKWFKFQATSNAMRIAITGTSGINDDNDLTLYEAPDNSLVELSAFIEENNVQPGGVLQQGVAADGGSETMITDMLTIGQTYYLCVRNINGIAGNVSLTVSILGASSPDIALLTGGTNTYTNTCQNFKVRFRANSAGYSINRWSSASMTGTPFTYTIPFTSTVASTVCQLGRFVQANLTGITQPVYVSVNVLYNLPNAFGTPVFAIARATGVSSFQLASEGDVNVRVSDRCPAFKSATGSIATNRSVCGTSRYQWEFTKMFPTAPAGVAEVYSGAAGGSRIFSLSNVSGMMNGNRYDVRVASRHADNVSTSLFGTIQCVRTIGNANVPVIEDEGVMAERSFNGVTASIFPNPNNGQTVNFSINGLDGSLNLKVTDATGREVYNNRFMVEGSMNTTLDFGQTLANGLYLVEMLQNGELKTMRMVVSK